MGLKCYILLLDLLLLGCGRSCSGADSLAKEAISSESNNGAVSDDDNARSTVAQLQELREPEHSEDTTVFESEHVPSTFTLGAQSSDIGEMNIEGEHTTPFPSQDFFKDELSGTNISSTVETASLDSFEPSLDQSSSSMSGGAALVTEVSNLELQEQPAEQEATIEAATSSEHPQQAIPDYKRGDVDTPVTDVPTDAVTTHIPHTSDKVGGEDEKSQAAEKMPTFAEWKEKKLAGQEKGGDQLPDAPGIQQKKKVSKGGRNYASYECGAKVLAANPEADGSGRVLNEMVDEYMLNPCKAKIWFIIELCEIIQISQVEIANFELFSSMPRDFSVSMSDRYPTRDWTQLGVFTALNQKAVQSFKLQSGGYGKYIKVELLSRYGSEHYCPLSLFRVYGTSMLEDYDQLDEKPQPIIQPNSEEEDEEGADRTEKSKNVVDRAKDAVMSILKVLRRDQEDSNSIGNISCSEDGQNCTTVTNVSASLMNASHGLHCQLPRVVSPAFEPCIICSQMVSSNMAGQSQASPICHFLRAALMPANECAENSLLLPPERDFPGQLTLSSKDDSSASKSITASPTTSTPSMESSTSEASESLESSRSLSSPSSVPVSTGSSENKPVQSTSTSTEQDDYKGSTTAQDGDVHNVTTSTSVSNEESLTTSRLQGSITTSSIIHDTIAPTPTIAVSPTDIETSPSGTQSTRGEVVSESSVAASDVAAVASVVEEDGALPQPTTDSLDEGDVAVTTEATLKEGSSVGRPAELGSSPGSQKESVFMRINNRIKVLELNMSLSSQYLEELSQRYRKQMEDMQRNFNRTISALNETTRMAAEKDQRQQEALVQLQQQLDNLTKIVDALLTERRSISREVFESHICLIMVEAIVVAAVFSLCLRRTHTLQQETHDWHHSQRHSSRSSLKRRSTESEQQSPTTQVVVAEKKQKPSEDSIDGGSRVVIIEPVVPIIMEPQQKEKAKKHKNKKQKGSKRKGSVPDTGPDGPRQQAVNTDVVDKETSAGVLFSSTTTLKATSIGTKETHSVHGKQILGGRVAANEQRTQPICIPARSMPVQMVTQKWKEPTAYGLCSQDTKLGLLKLFPHAGKTPV